MREDGRLKVVLVTSAAGFWIFPKGNFEDEHGKCGTAELEAYEEAGVKGKVDPKRRYRTNVIISGGRRARLVLYPLEISKLCKEWPEAFRRERRIVSLKDAGRLLGSDGLRKCLNRFARDFSG
jgi:8-oxo-dGTP pyrophosphatase MutT (NUDIX family)